MTRTAIVLLTLGLVVTFLPAADDPPTRKTDPATGRKKDSADKKDALAGPEEGDSKAKELLGRVAKNMGASEDRLKNQDPGAETRKIQDQIVKDLDELIKKSQEQNDSDCNCQQSSSQSSSGQSSKTTQSRRASRKSSSGQKQQSAQQQAQQSGDKKGNQSQKNQSGAQKGNGPPKEQTASKSGTGQDPKNKGGATPGGGNSSAQKNKSTIADLFRDVWGHLPEQKRQEMDAFSRERFLPRYDELLRQYYRTLSESRKKDGD
jgi:hypothetical protein